ncbi:MAG: dTDP-4-dehydrorhamnose reductase [Lachnospiraceae bacterium]
MRVLVTGANGQLGIAVIEELERSGHVAIGVDHSHMDITSPEVVESVVGAAQVDGIIHCAAYTAVDTAEEEQELCQKVNGYGTENLAKTCNKLGLKMLYVSTDYVFSGENDGDKSTEKDKYEDKYKENVRPWEPEDRCQPVNVYGRSKQEGELAIQTWLDAYFIVRTSWVFGEHGKNFPQTMLRLSETKEQLRVVADQIGSPTYTADLARLLVEMIQTQEYGIYHATNEGFCSWYEYACEIFRQANIPIEITPVTSEEFLTKARRPKNSRLSKDNLETHGFHRLPPWQEALSRYLKHII